MRMSGALIPVAIILAAGLVKAILPAHADSSAKSGLAESYIAGFFRAMVETATAPQSEADAITAVQALLLRDVPLDETARFMLGRAWPADNLETGRRFQEQFRVFAAEAVTQGIRTTPTLALSVKGSRKRTDGSTLVLSTLALPSGTSVPVDWRVASDPTTGGLQIVDLTVAGFNAAMLLRSMAEATLEKTDVEGLIPHWRAAMTRRTAGTEGATVTSP
jgi:ABC-type transporter MlaC component